jgi:N,N'-diacetyllegionaminate synthase
MYSDTLQINGKTVGGQCPCFIIAEVGVNHEGSLSCCIAMVEEFAAAGADAIKLQVSDPAVHYAKGTDSYKLFSSSWLDLSAIEQVAARCSELNVGFCVTCGDATTFEFINKLQPCLHKISSGMFVHRKFMSLVINSSAPMVCSTGMATSKEVEMQVGWLRSQKFDNFALLQCTSLYPAPPDMLNLRVMETFREKFNCCVGYSDHLQNTKGCEVAVAAGASIIEKHVSLDPSRKGFDHQISASPHEFAAMVQSIRETEQMLGVREKFVCDAESKVRNSLGRYLVYGRDMNPREVLKLQDVNFMRVQDNRL